MENNMLKGFDENTSFISQPVEKEKPEYSKAGTEIYLDNRGRKLKAVVARPPFRK